MKSGAKSQNSPGSLWRRWDPHVHFPGTLLNDQYKGMSIPEALDVLAKKQPSIEVVGVTEYCVTSTFREVNKAWRSGAGENIKFLFPNIELRLDTPTAKGSGVNIHLLCSPDQVDGLDNFLGGLDFTWDDQRYYAREDSLVQFGRAFKADPKLNRQAALCVGAGQFKVSFEQLHQQFKSDSWAQKHCLVAVAGSQGDGTSGVRTPDGAFVARRQGIERFAHIIFSSNARQVDFWLGRGADSIEKLQRLYAGLKLCIHGCDAHKPQSLGVTTGDRYTWIKGDASFETLRMACLAPESRAKIASLIPTAGYTYGRISKVTVTGENFINPSSIPINPGLIAIIGSRGSGKTALADIAAVGSGSLQPFDNSSSFIRRAGYLLRDAIANVEWSHGETTTNSCFDVPQEADRNERGVRYLSQQFVEQLCASDGVSEDLLNEIERVVFSAFPRERRQGATNFAELLDARLAIAHGKQQAEQYSIVEIGDTIATQMTLKAGLNKRAEAVNTQNKMVAETTSKINDLTRTAESGQADRLALVSSACSRRVEEVQRIDRRIGVLNSLLSEVQNSRSTLFPQHMENLRRKYPLADLSDKNWREFIPKYAGDVDSIVNAELRTASTAKEKISGKPAENADTNDLSDLSADEINRLTLAELIREQERLQQLVGLDEHRRKKLTVLREQQTNEQARLTRLNEELTAARNADKQINLLTVSRLQHYAAYFDALLEEEEELETLYAPLSAMLKTFGSSVAKLNFSVRRKVDIDSWSSQGEELLDLRKMGPFRGSGVLRRRAESELVPVWAKESGQAVAGAIKQFSEKYSNDLRQQSRVERSDSAAYKAWERDVSRWLYNADHVSLSYSLDYDGVGIERLSPGSRGIVLLLLYLAIDQDESDPLIIDQPEENLDPESVYTELVQLFRSASERRQIIMVTHNANLVVNTDVDQVIIARCGRLEEGSLPELSYQSGGLEDESVRAAVCEVLEGGAEAFKQRARRLRIKL